MLALAKRTNKDPRTLGTLFHACCEELQQATFAEALALVLMFLEQAMGAATEMTRETAPLPDRPVSQGSTANLRGTVATCMAK